MLDSLPAVEFREPDGASDYKACNDSRDEFLPPGELVLHAALLATLVFSAAPAPGAGDPLGDFTLHAERPDVRATEQENERGGDDLILLRPTERRHRVIEKLWIA